MQMNPVLGHNFIHKVAQKLTKIDFWASVGLFQFVDKFTFKAGLKITVIWRLSPQVMLFPCLNGCLDVARNNKNNKLLKTTQNV